MKSMDIAAFGMAAQSERLKIISQNIANADSVSLDENGQPYQRKTISFRNVLNKELGVNTVVIDKVSTDKSPFQMKYSPNHPLADDKGYILRPNVNTLVEMTDMREAKNVYQANLSVIEITKTMVSRTLDLLRT